ncbi:MAG: response regulator [Candidatus Marinimicrobia bacterium]|nr:response regulator [Candidatus Neomarinimicrobiota bacterium]MCF7922356.1 response regulator [Candidatus Neomarinimicrobiota bacterium]
MQHILYVEDHMDTIDLVQQIFEDQFIIDWATSVEDAKMLLNEHTHKLILMDIALRGKFTGIDYVKELKSDMALRHIPVVALTAFAGSYDRATALSAGFDEYIEKPFEPSLLMEVVARFLPGHT